MGYTNKYTHSLGFLLLGKLQYLGRGCYFDDLEEATGINGEAHRKFSINLLNLDNDMYIHLL